MRGKQVIDATRLEGTITTTRGGIVIKDQRIPLEDVAVILMGARSTVSGGALTLLSKYDVVLLNCDWNGVPNLVGYAWSDNSRVAARHKAQAELSMPRRKSAWANIVRAKIHGQANNVTSAGGNAKTLIRLRSEVRSGDPSNCEAQAARLYWKEYFGGLDESFRREPGGVDRLNSLLNYGYTVMRGFVIQAVARAGMWPTLGIWHRNRGNTFAIADDLIEPFRPALDYVVHALPQAASLDDGVTKRSLVETLSLPMSRDSGSTVGTCIYDLAAQLAIYVEGERASIEPAIWSPVM